MTREVQPSLFPVASAGVTLTERQAFALELLQRAGSEGLRADELGATLCERNGRHPSGSRCEYDKANGLGVLRALRTKGVAKSRRDGSWYATAAVEHAAGDASFGEFSEDF